MGAGWDQLTQEKQVDPQICVCPDKALGIVQAMGQAEKLL
jgi:hypothetical protein